VFRLGFENLGYSLCLYFAFQTGRFLAQGATAYLVVIGFHHIVHRPHEANDLLLSQLLWRRSQNPRRARWSHGRTLALL
jgi:hypothetical protein